MQALRNALQAFLRVYIFSGNSFTLRKVGWCDGVSKFAVIKLFVIV